jgi:integrase
VDLSAQKLGIDKKPIKEISRKHFVAIFEQCEKDNSRFTKNRQNVYRKWLIKLYKILFKLEAVETNPLKDIEKEKITKNERILATYEQRTIINNYLRSNYYYLWRLMQIFFTSDARQIELYRVQKKHVNLKDQSCLYLVKKGQEERWIRRPIIDAALFLWQEILSECKSDEYYLFSIGMRPGVKQQNSEQFGRAWRRHVNGTLKTKRKENSRKKHVPVEKLNINVKLNSLRHQSITEMMDRLDKQYNPVKEVSELTGHKSGKMIAKVYDLNFEERKNDKVKKLGGLF